jgi:hypothetical protein
MIVSQNSMGIEMQLDDLANSASYAQSPSFPFGPLTKRLISLLGPSETIFKRSGTLGPTWSLGEPMPED